jgi:hypothetical protein
VTEIRFIFIFLGRFGRLAHYREICSMPNGCCIAKHWRRVRLASPILFFGTKFLTMSYDGAQGWTIPVAEGTTNIYLKLIPWMNAWFSERGKVFPGTLRNWNDETHMEGCSRSPNLPGRYDPVVVDRMIAALDQGET